MEEKIRGVVREDLTSKTRKNQPGEDRTESCPGRRASKRDYDSFSETWDVKEYMGLCKNVYRK